MQSDELVIHYRFYLCKIFLRLWKGCLWISPESLLNTGMDLLLKSLPQIFLLKMLMCFTGLDFLHSQTCEFYGSSECPLKIL